MAEAPKNGRIEEERKFRCPYSVRHRRDPSISPTPLRARREAGGTPSPRSSPGSSSVIIPDRRDTPHFPLPPELGATLGLIRPSPVETPRGEKTDPD
jgi:hypothetical protein